MPIVFRIRRAFGICLWALSVLAIASLAVSYFRAYYAHRLVYPSPHAMESQSSVTLGSANGEVIFESMQYLTSVTDWVAYDPATKTTTTGQRLPVDWFWIGSKAGSPRVVPHLRNGFGFSASDVSGVEMWPEQGGFAKMPYDLVVVTVPHWAIILLTAALAWWCGRPARMARRRRKAGQCPGCGYDLRASPGQCPECGAVSPVPSGGNATPAAVQL